MNYKEIFVLPDLNEIFYAPIHMDQTSTDEESYHNMWWLTLAIKETPLNLLSYLMQFFSNLLQQRKQQLPPGYKATFYAWIDEQAGQLRFNIISGHKKNLPFGCSVQRIKNIEPLIVQWIHLKDPGIIPWNEVTFDDNIINDDDEIDYTLQVFVQFM